MTAENEPVAEVRAQAGSKAFRRQEQVSRTEIKEVVMRKVILKLQALFVGILLLTSLLIRTAAAQSQRFSDAELLSHV